MANYLKALQMLNKIPKFKESKTNLDNILAILKLMGNPEKQFQSIHIAGTNGKGSVTLKIAKILEAAGLKTGLFTSPHLFSYRERIQINGEKIPKEYMADNIQLLFKLAETHKISMAFFDYITVLCFQYFKESQIQVASIEVGLGGRLDATNVIQPLASVITSIDFDHCEILGNTLAQIAYEKAGIIKQNIPVILGPNAKPIEIFKYQCDKMKSNFIQVKQTEDILSNFDCENNEIVLKTFQVLQNNPLISKFVKQEHINKGLLSKQQCRLEPLLESKINQLKNKPKQLYFDVGHNPGALEKSLYQLKVKNPLSDITVIYGTSHVKDDTSSLKVLLQYCKKIFIIQAEHFRAKQITSILESINYLKTEYNNIDQQIQDIVENGNIKKTIDKALQECSNKEIIIINGSFFIMREAREYFNYEDDKDDIELNQLK